MPNRFFGVDVETTTDDISRGGRLIQIVVTADTDPQGNSLPGTDAFCALLNPGEFSWDIGSEGIHGFTQEDVVGAQPANQVDIALETWLLKNGATEEYRGNIIPVGFGVGAFDMPHIKLILPRSYARFSRRTAELNSIMYALEGSSLIADFDTDNDRDAWKRISVQYAERTIASLTKNQDVKAAHDAGYDALLHLHAWRFLKAAVHGTALTMPENIVESPRSRVMVNKLIEDLGLESASERTGIPADFISGWANGGRALNLPYLEQLSRVYGEIINPSI